MVSKWFKIPVNKWKQEKKLFILYSVNHYYWKTFWLMPPSYLVQSLNSPFPMTGLVPSKYNPPWPLQYLADASRFTSFNRMLHSGFYPNGWLNIHAHLLERSFHIYVAVVLLFWKLWKTHPRQIYQASMPSEAPRQVGSSAP